MKNFLFKNIKKQNIFILVLQILLILYWLIILRKSDAFYAPYLIAGSCGIVSAFFNMRTKSDSKNASKKDKSILVIAAFSVLFSIMAVSANYGMFSEGSIPESSVSSFLYGRKSVIIMLVSGFLVFWNLLNCLKNRLGDYIWKEEKKYKLPSIYIFFAMMFAISVINILIMYLCYYPGNVSPDSMEIIKQILDGSYSNHHPFYYTKTVELFLAWGMNRFHDMNSAIACFSVFQIIFMAACISLVIVTMYQMKVSWKVILGCLIWYLVMPFHIMYSFTMWKDVMFGGAVAAFIVSLFRIWEKIGKFSRLNYCFLLASGVGVCLLRSNGWFAFLLTFFCFLFLFEESAEKKKMRVLLLGILLGTFVLKHPVLNALNVRQPDALESLSIPAQQIARIVSDCDDVREEQKELLRKIVDADQIPDVYIPYLSDPIKKLVRETGNIQYLTNHKAVYIKLYLEMNLAHLDKSMEAWIDQTRGYWNGGYFYWWWVDQVVENDIGAERVVHVPTMKQAMDKYLWMYTDNPVLQIFLSIGFHVWIVLILMVLCIVRRNREGLFLTIPLISIVISLLVSTPVYSEFRYAYAVFCCIPFLLAAVFYRKDDNAEDVREEE